MHTLQIGSRSLFLSFLLGMSAFALACDSGEKTPTAAKESTKAPAKAAEPEAKEAEPEAKAEEPETKAEEPETKAEEPETKEEPAKEDPPKKDPPKKDPPKKDPPKKDPPKKDPPKKDPPKDEPVASGVDGKEIYRKKCKNCHGLKGDSDTKIGKKHDIPSWKEPGWKSKWTLAKVKDIVINGKSGTKMKSFKTKLTPEEIDAVSVYSRKLGS